ncbi:outer membrane autotransporter barrel domain protein [Yersinia rohdei]|uniref:Outer membrane autotransporter barrel domain protein n=2 Tax=Yersinia rohdei TaxID=29485 RepID=A0ABM5S9E9_YERRO|nr:outer membrane autotransporter barrel domain protein [Yersinia rohdei]
MLNTNRHKPRNYVLRFKRPLLTVILSSLTATAYAGSCTSGAGGTYFCSDSAVAGTDITQVLDGGASPLDVTTLPDFSIVTSTGDALTLNGTGGVNFTDNNSAIITGAEDGIDARNNTSGDLSITTTGAVTGSSSVGISAMNTGSNLTINAGDVSGGSHGIVASNSGSGALSISTTGAVTGTRNEGVAAYNSGTDLTMTTADVAGGQVGVLAYNLGSGELSVTTTGTVTGTDQYGITAFNMGTGLTVAAADVAGGETGINARNSGSGALSITASGAVTGSSKIGISAYNNGNGLTINASDISGGTHGIVASNNGGGAMSITTTGAVTGTRNEGVAAYNSGTDLTMTTADVAGGQVGVLAYNLGSGELSVTTTGTVTGTDQYGITAFNMGTGLTVAAADVAGGETGINARNNGTGALSITTTGTVTGANNYGIEAVNQGTGPVALTVGAGSTVQGTVAGISVEAASPIDITNAGTIRNLSNLSSDIAIKTRSASGTLTNSGLVQGTVQLSDSGNTVINNAGGTWDTSGGTNDLGALVADNSVLNNGLIIAANGSATDPRQTTTFDHVGTFTNAGVLSLANGRVGDVTVINGDYVGNGGSLWLNTALSDDSSVADKLVINGNTSGSTSVRVDNLGGTGAQTLNGIELIQVNGLSDGEFIKSDRIVAGAYDYSLVRGLNSNDSNWYLSSGLSPFDPTDGSATLQVQRPEVGAYSANLAAANNMFVTRLHDHLGETQYIDALTGEQKTTSLWLRNEGGHNRSRDSSGQLKTQANRYVVQLGGDIAQWSHNNLDRFHLGLMAGYGKSNSTTVSSLSGYNAKGETYGYSTGVYGTWYANDSDKSGLYVDSWAQYSWFNNSVDGEYLAREEYKSKGITASIESGYTFKMGENTAKNATYFIQPKAQVTWMGVKADDHKEANGTHVTGEGNDNIQTRLGIKAFMNGYSDIDAGKDRVFQPFVEANWVHNTENFGTNMNGATVKQEGAANIAEMKVGVEGQLNQQVNMWGNVGQQIGNKGYSDTAVMLGVKYNF